MTTESNIEYETRVIYKDQLKHVNPKDMDENHVDFIIHKLIEASNELMHQRADTVRLLKAYAEVNNLSFITNQEETYFAGPKAETTRLKDTSAGNGWIFQYVRPGTPKKQIAAAINEMRTYGHRKSKGSQSKPQPIQKLQSNPSFFFKM